METGIRIESIGFGDHINTDLPILKDTFKNILNEEYILLAPYTSGWEEQKRSWGYDRFTILAELLNKEYGLKCVMLEKSYSFSDMMSLIRHCKFFIGNDSGPANIAQCYNKKSFIIFGGINPKYIHLSKQAVPIYDSKRHALCNHKTRYEELNCCEDFCMERIRPKDVLNTIKQNI